MLFSHVLGSFYLNVILNALNSNRASRFMSVKLLHYFSVPSWFFKKEVWYNVSNPDFYIKRRVITSFAYYKWNSCRESYNCCNLYYTGTYRVYIWPIFIPNWKTIAWHKTFLTCDKVFLKIINLSHNTLRVKVLLIQL